MRSNMVLVLAGLLFASACSKQSSTPPTHSNPPPATPGATGTSMTKPSSGLESTNWRLIELAGAPVTFSGDRMASIELDPTTKRFAGSGGCNRISGGYVVEGRSLRFQEAVATRMACPDGMDTEQAFLKALTEVDAYGVIDGKLQLMQGERVLARLEPLIP